MIINAKIRKLPNGKYRVLSEKGKNLGTYDSLSGAKNRLRQVEFFKHKKAEEFTFSSVMRDLRKNNPDKVLDFLYRFNQNFLKAYNNVDDPEQVALMETLNAE